MLLLARICWIDIIRPETNLSEFYTWVRREMKEESGHIYLKTEIEDGDSGVLVIIPRA